MPDDESMITPAMEAAIGREGDPITFEINRELVRRLAEAIDEDDPEILAAIAADDPTRELPSYALLVGHTRLRQEEVPDASGFGLMAADELQLFAPIRAGDRLSVVARIADIQERIGGRVGHSLFIHHEWVYTNQDGVEVARTRRTITHFKDRHTGE